MFGSKNEEKGFSKNGSVSDKTNQFVEGTIIEGNVKSNSDIRVDGEIVGKIYSDAKIVVGAKGMIDGDIRCKNADISGVIKGRIEVKELLFLKGTSIIEGDIIANKLVVDKGAKFNGTCNMGSGQQQMHDAEQTQKIKKEAI